MGSAGQLGITASTSYTTEEILAMTWGVFWLILSAIVLLNMLIALVSNAYQNSEVCESFVIDKHNLQTFQFRTTQRPNGCT